MQMLLGVARTCDRWLAAQPDAALHVQSFLLPLDVLGPAFAFQLGGRRLLALWMDAVGVFSVPWAEYSAPVLYEVIKRCGEPSLARVLGEEDGGITEMTWRSVVDLAVEGGDRVLLERLHVHELSLDTPASLRIAAQRGDLDLLKWLYDKRIGRAVTRSTAVYGIYSGSLAVVEWLFDKALPLSPHTFDYVLRVAARSGHTAVVQWLCGKPGSPARWTRPVDRAIENGHLVVADLLLQRVRQEWSSVDSWRGSVLKVWRALRRVFLSGDLATLQWMHERGLVRDYLRRPHVDAAKVNGRVELLRFVVDTYPDLSANWMAFDADAAIGGSIAVAQWAHDRGQLVVSPSLIYRAVRHGHMPFVRWYHGRVGRDFTFKRCRRLLYKATQDGHLASVQFLVETKVAAISNVVVQLAAIHGHAAVVRWLVAHSPRGMCHSFAVGCAARGGHLDAMLSFARRDLEQNAEAFVQAAANGHFEVVLWMLQNVTVTDAHRLRALQYAVEHGHLSAVRELIATHRSSSPRLAAIARKRGHAHVANWLARYGYHQRRIVSCSVHTVLYWKEECC